MPPDTASASPFARRLFRVPGADYMHEWQTALSAHTDAALAQVRADGFDAVWVRAVLRELVPSDAFPELRPAPGNLAVLRQLTARCQRHGLNLFLYLNEPLGFPATDPFWTAHPEVRGVPGASPDDGWAHSFALCTSSEPTRRFLFEATRNLFLAVPGLRGAFLITASEHHTHCFSHEWALKGTAGWQQRFACPRCARRNPAEVIGEVVRLVRDGARAGNPGAEIIAWNWSWSMFEDDPQPGILAALPAVPLLADFERGGRRRVRLRTAGCTVDREIPVDEYSLAYIGPSDRFLGTFAAARARRRPCYAKLQIGTTHEIATVPNLPLIPNLYRKFAALRRLGVPGLLGCWNFGNAPTLNTFAAGRLMQDPPPASEETFLTATARDYFPRCAPGRVAAAWRHFSAAMEFHPFSMPFVYLGPVNYAPVCPWRLEPPARPLQGSWYVLEDYGDRLADCCGPFSPLEVECLLAALVRRWRRGLTELDAGLAPAASERHAGEEQRVAHMIACQFRSALHLFRFQRLRDAWLAAPTADRARAWQNVARAEVANLRACLPLVEADPRLGWHAGSFPHPHRFYDAPGIRRQIDALAALRRAVLP